MANYKIITTTQEEPTRKAMKYNVTLRRVRVTIVAVEKAIRITYSERVFVALGIQHAMRMHHNVVCCLSGSPVFFHISHKRHDFNKSSY